MRSARKLRLLALALALAASACLTAVASRDTNAYFTNVYTGRMGGTLGSSSAECPYRLSPGTSKARHWNLNDVQHPRVLPIAQYDSSGTLFLDFGEEGPGNSNASPDVFRLVSLVTDPRAVRFSVSGQMAAFVTEVRLKDGGFALPEGATESVYVKLAVPHDAQLGTYSGTLTVHVDGWDLDTHVPMMITVRRTSPGGTSAATPAATPAPASTITPSEDPAVTPSPTPTVAPSENPATTPPATPLATPTAAPAPTLTSEAASPWGRSSG